MIPPLRLMGTFPFKPTSPHTQTQRHTHSKDTQILHHGPTTPFTHTQLPPDAQQKEAKTTGNRHTQTPTDYKCLNFDSERPLNEAETSTQIHPEMSLHKPLTCSTSTGALNRVGDSPLMAEGITQQVVGVEGRPQHASQPLPSMAPFPQLQTLDITNNLVRMCFTLSTYSMHHPYFCPTLETVFKTVYATLHNATHSLPPPFTVIK